MKIQEMRPGLLQINRKTEPVRRDELFDFFDDEGSDAPPPEATPIVLSELDRPQWSVVSFDRHEAGGLSYREGMALSRKLEAEGISGLCIVTDEAALRFRR